MATLSSLNLNNRIVRTPLDTSSIPLKAVTDKMKVSKSMSYSKAQGEEMGLKDADSEAVSFYLLNHLIADLQVRKGDHGELTEDEEKLVKVYFKNVNEQAKRMFYYVLAICTRESRHTQTGTAVGTKEKFGTTKGLILNKFNTLIRKTGSDGAVSQLLDHTPNIDLGTFVSHLEYLFFQGSFGGGYGGPKWGEVAKTLRKCVHGEMSLELMIDCAYNLSHNNGPIFNKGMWYNGYSHQFIEILDVQRSGQMPVYVNDIIEKQGSHISEFSTEAHTLGLKVCPELFKGYTDWYVVEASGSVGKYNTHKEQQVMTHGESEKFKEAAAVQKIKVEKAEKAKAEAKKDIIDFGFSQFKKFELQRSE